MLQLRQAYFQISSLGVGSYTINRAFTPSKGNVVFLIRDEGRRHNFMNIILVFSDRFFFLQQLRFEVLFEVMSGSWWWLWRLGLYLGVYDLVNGDVGVDIFVFLCLLLLVELISFCYLCRFFVAVGVIFGAMLQSYFHVLHSPIQITYLPDLLLFPLQVPQLYYLPSLGWLGLDFCSQYWQTYYFSQVHVALCVDFYLEYVVCFFLKWGNLLLFGGLSCLTGGLGFSLFLSWNFDLFGYQKLCLLLQLFGLSRRFQGLRLSALVSDLLVDDLNRAFEDKCQFQNPRIILMNLVELQDQSFTYLVDSQIVPFTPGTVVPQIFLPVLTVNRLDLLKLLHKLKIYRLDHVGFSEARCCQGGSFRKLDVDGDEEVGEELDVQKFAPGRAEVEHEFIEDFFIDFYSQQLESVVRAHPHQNAQVLLPLREGLNVDGIQLLLDQFAEVLVGYLFTSVRRHHSLIGETLSHLFDPVVEPRHQCILELETRQQRFLQFEIELHELDESYLESLSGWQVEEQKNVFYDLLEEGMVVDGQFPVDVGSLFASLHLSSYMNYELYTMRESYTLSSHGCNTKLKIILSFCKRTSRQCQTGELFSPLEHNA